MNVELKPIAESKVRQLGGDVCGVLVRKEDGTIMAVSEDGRCTRLDAGVMGPVDPAATMDKEDALDCALSGQSYTERLIQSVCDYLNAIAFDLTASHTVDGQWPASERDTAFEVDHLRRMAGELRKLDIVPQQAARAQSGLGAEPIGFIPCSGLNNLAFGHPAKIYPVSATPSPFESHSLLYTQPAQQGSVPRWKELEALADGYVEGYEFRGDEGDYHPNERERFLIEDCVTGLLDEVHQMLKRTTPQPKSDGWVKCSERLPRPRKNTRKAPNGILVKFNTGRVAQIHDVTETLVARMKNGPRQSSKFEAPVLPRIIEWLDLDEADRVGGNDDGN